jgi:hypothetical protein
MLSSCRRSLTFDGQNPYPGASMSLSFNPLVFHPGTSCSSLQYSLLYLEARLVAPLHSTVVVPVCTIQYVKSIDANVLISDVDKYYASY